MPAPESYIKGGGGTPGLGAGVGATNQPNPGGTKTIGGLQNTANNFTPGATTAFITGRFALLHFTTVECLTNIKPYCPPTIFDSITAKPSLVFDFIVFFNDHFFKCSQIAANKIK